MPYIVLSEATAAAPFTTTHGAPRTSEGETLDSLRTELGLQLASRDDVDSTRIDKWINWAYRNLCGMLRLTEMKGSGTISVVADQPFYNIPIQVASITRLVVSDADTYPLEEGRELEMIDEAGYRTLPVLSEEPEKYFRWRRTIVLWPTPSTDRSLILDFRIRPDDLVNDTDSPILPQEFHEPLLLLARHRAWRSLLDYKQAKEAYNDFLVCTRPLLSTDAEETQAQNGTVFLARSRRDLYRGNV